VPASSILLLEADPAEADRIGEILRAAGHAVDLADDGPGLVGNAAGHASLLIDLPGDGTAAAALVRELRATPRAAPLPILCFAQTAEVDERVRLLEAGADDVIARPFDARELAARVDALSARFLLSGGSTPVQPEPAAATRRHQVISFFGAKGGVGTTTIAVNVSLDLAGRQPGQVALVDLALPLGQVPTHLDLKPRHQFADLLGGEEGGVRSAAERYGGMDVFCSPDDPEIADRITAIEIVGALDALREAYMFVTVDAGSSLDSRTLALLAASDRIVLVTVPEIPSLRALVAVEQVLGERRLAERMIHVVNHLFAHEPLKRSDIEETLGTSVALELPHHDLLFAKAVNEGVPVVRSAPRSEPAERLAQLASIVAGTAEPGGDPATPRKRFRLLGRGA
jgi:pilus assembly protein CpaE